MSNIPSQDTSGNQFFLPSTSNITDISLISIYWSDILGKPSFCNVAITADYNDLINLPSISGSGSSSVMFSGDYNSLSNLSWINNNSNIYFVRNGNVGIGTTNPNNKLHLIGNFSIEGNIIPTITSNFDLGSSNFKLKDLYLSSNSIFLDNLILSKNNSNNLEIKDTNGNFKNLNINSIELNNLNDKVILSLSNQQLFFNSNGTILNSINFNNYSNIIYSNVFSNTSNSIINYINTNINNINIPNTDTIIIGTSNKFISSNIYNNNLIISSNLFVNGNYYLKNQLLPFSITSNTSISSSNGLFNYIINCNNFCYYTFLTNGSITVPQTTNCDILVVGAGGNGGQGTFSGGGGAGEVIYYSNYQFNQGTYNIKIGYSDFNSNNRISRISSNNISITAKGGGDGGFFISSTYSSTLSNVVFNNANILYNYTDISSNINGTSNIIFDNGAITIGNLTPNRSYPILKDSSGNNINPKIWYKLDNANFTTDELGLLNLTNLRTCFPNTSNFIKGNASLQFTGTSCLESVATTLFRESNFTFSVWVRLTNINNNYKCIASNRSDVLKGWAIYVTSTGGTFPDGSGASQLYTLTLWYGTGTAGVYGPVKFLNNYFPQYLNVWTHIVMTGRKTGVGNNCDSRCYINGSFISSGTQPYDNTQNIKFRIGDITDGADIQFQLDAGSLVDDFRYYNQVLTDSQILELYRGSVNITNIFEPTSGGSGGGGGYTSNLFQNGANFGTTWNSLYSYATNGSNAILNKGGNGGSARSNIGFSTLITGTNLIIGEGGIGATSNSIPVLDQTYGSGGDGNGGLGTQGIVIIRTPLDIIKSSFDGYINYSNIINRPVLNDLFATNNYINIGYNNQINFPLADVSWNNEWFLYIGISPTSIANSFIFWHLTSNINSKWWFNGTTAITNAEISDFRIKKKITNIQNPIDKFMALQPKEYYICNDKDYLKKYGILAQDVYSNQDLKHLVFQDEEYIANIYTNASYNNKIITTEISIIDKIEINDELKILIDNSNESKEIIIDELPYHNRYKKRYIKIKEIINDYSFEIYEEIEIMEQEKNKIFIYGKKVQDFLKLDYSSLYSLNIQFNKELYNLIQSNNLLINNLNERINKLEK